MGLCASGDAQGTAQEQERDRKINAGLRKQQKQVENEDAKRMLLLGAGQSGKSTLFKQTQLLYGKKLAKEEMESYIPIIIGNTISSMQTLVEKSEELPERKKDGKEKYEHKCPKEADIVKDSDRESLDAELGEAIATLWKDPGIQATFTEKHEFQLIDSASYYFGKVRQIADDKWFPDEEDVLRSRARTTGIVTTEFVVQEHHFKMFDVGGQKSERKKWVPFFEGVDCVLFVAAISGYNKTLFEDGKTNRMEDAMDLFEKTVKEKMLEKSSLVLFLNKSDLFQEEIKRFPITSCPRLADYTGDHSYKDTTNFIKEKFEKLVPPTRDCTIHITCATDRHNIKVVFDSVREHVLNESLAAAGLTQTMMQ
eukprot:CAMPEP_0167786336 /NCGR_PEP_ID=MMETSP0111_2-20121227/8728_1 /TAXON_ID=91324 /ORGANISM="Lotharella globosa, Strain CCCM811" /LENGTH=366 /DNA_ID=CAMNT_0007677691 /DNA_START=49 /DNA_END=1150 /DNA_ORIENTATION=+